MQPLQPGTASGLALGAAFGQSDSSSCPIEPASFQYLSVAGVCRNGLKFESGRTHLFIDVPVEMPHLTSGAGARRTDPRAASMARARKARNSVKLRRRHWHLPHCSSDVCWRCMLREHGWEGGNLQNKDKARNAGVANVLLPRETTQNTTRLTCMRI